MSRDFVSIQTVAIPASAAGVESRSTLAAGLPGFSGRVDPARRSPVAARRSGLTGVSGAGKCIALVRSSTTRSPGRTRYFAGRSQVSWARADAGTVTARSKAAEHTLEARGAGGTRRRLKQVTPPPLARLTGIKP